MRILVGTSEICGWVNLLQQQLIQLGHDCDSLVKNRNHFYSSASYTYDTSRYQLPPAYQKGLLAKPVTKFNELSKKTYLSSFVKHAAGKYDLVIYIWDTILPNFEDVKIFSDNGAKIVFWFAGSDVRTFEQFSHSYDVSHWTFPDYWTKEDVTRKLQYVQVAEKYADLIYSVPDQAGLQSKPYYHLQIPIDLNRFTFKNNQRAVPNVLHLPSDPWKKGTDIIERAITQLVDEGIKVNFHSYRNIPHQKIPEILQDMDILVDEIVFHGPGVLGFEAMASGCAVATRYIETSPDNFRPPLVNVDAKNIKERLSKVFTDYNLQQQLIQDGRAYVEKNNNSAVVVHNLLNNLLHPAEPDYILNHRSALFQHH